MVLLLAYGAGFGHAIHAIFSGYGLKRIGLFSGRTSMQVGGQKAGTPIRMTLDDVDRIRTTVPLVTAITPQAFKDAVFQYETRSYSMSVGGFYPNVVSIRMLDLAEQPELLQLRARLLYSIGWVYDQQGRYDVAIKAHLDSLRLLDHMDFPQQDQAHLRALQIDKGRVLLQRLG